MQHLQTFFRTRSRYFLLYRIFAQIICNLLKLVQLFALYENRKSDLANGRIEIGTENAKISAYPPRPIAMES